MVRAGVTLNHSTREKLRELKIAKRKKGQAESPDPLINLVELIGIEPTAS